VNLLTNDGVVNSSFEEGNDIKDEVDAGKRKQNDIDDKKDEVLILPNVIGIVANKDQLDKDFIYPNEFINGFPNLIKDPAGVIKLEGF
jgi:hypothetical protein